MDRFGKATTSWSKRTPESSLVTSPWSWKKSKLLTSVRRMSLKWSKVIIIDYRLLRLPNMTKTPYFPIFFIVFYSKTMEKLRIQSFLWRHAFQILKIWTVDPHSDRNYWAECHWLHTKWFFKVTRYRSCTPDHNDIFLLFERKYPILFIVFSLALAFSISSDM